MLQYVRSRNWKKSYFSERRKICFMLLTTISDITNLVSKENNLWTDCKNQILNILQIFKFTFQYTAAVRRTKTTSRRCSTRDSSRKSSVCWRCEEKILWNWEKSETRPRIFNLDYDFDSYSVFRRFSDWRDGRIANVARCSLRFSGTFSVSPKCCRY